MDDSEIAVPQESIRAIIAPLWKAVKQFEKKGFIESSATLALYLISASDEIEKSNGTPSLRLDLMLQELDENPWMLAHNPETERFLAEARHLAEIFRNRTMEEYLFEARTNLSALAKELSPTQDSLLRIVGTEDWANEAKEIITSEIATLVDDPYLRWVEGELGGKPALWSLVPEILTDWRNVLNMKREFVDIYFDFLIESVESHLNHRSDYLRISVSEVGFEFHSLLAMGYFDVERWHEAEQEINRALKYDDLPRFKLGLRSRVVNLTNLGSIFFNQRRFDDAKRSYEDAIATFVEGDSTTRSDGAACEAVQLAEVTISKYLTLRWHGRVAAILKRKREIILTEFIFPRFPYRHKVNS